MVNKVVCVIPARLASKRFPQKIFSEIGGKTLLERVFEAATSCPQFDDVWFAIDSKEAKDHIAKFTSNYFMTDPKTPSGTHRIIEFMERGPVTANVWVNWQVDEPMIRKEMIDDLLQGVGREGGIWTLKKEITNKSSIEDPNTVKVVTDIHGKALYFSRAPIPFIRDMEINAPIYKHIGLYAYSTEALKAISQMTIGRLARIEKLEQLTFLENGLSIYVYPTRHDSIGIDTPEAAEKASLAFNLTTD